MIENFISMISAYAIPEVLSEWIYPIFMGYFVCAVPGIIRAMTKWR